MSGPAQRTASATLGELFTLADAHTENRVVVAPERGALVSSWSLAGRELLYMDDSTLHDTTKNVRGGIPVLFPSPGKLPSDTFAQRGRVGTDLKQHGFARLLPWKVARSSADSIELSLAADAFTLTRFPWQFQAQLSLRVYGRSLQLRFSLHNADTDALPFALGYHPYFLVDDLTEKPQLAIASRATQAFDNVRKQIVPFAGFDLTQPELDLHLLDHGSQHSVLRWPDGSQVELSADPEFAVWVVWTLAQRDFVCVEPWTARANALNSGDGLLTVEPGETRSLSVELTYTPAA
ncbi:MAG TPA: galactose mutarotase [Polyangiales bacterium]|jgi:galactose mutarotase-like enzyme|nr:galactose mutarotase [Polyangiales bacterium]